MRKRYDHRLLTYNSMRAYSENFLKDLKRIERNGYELVAINTQNKVTEAWFKRPFQSDSVPYRRRS